MNGLLFLISSAFATTSATVTEEPAPVVDFESFRQEMEAVTVTVIYAADGIPIVTVSEPFIKKDAPITAEDVKIFLE